MRNDRVHVGLVTGANRGLGLETARQRLAKELVLVLPDGDIVAARVMPDLRPAHRRRTRLL